MALINGRKHMGTVTGVMSPRNQWSDRGPPLLITGFSEAPGHLSYLPGEGMINEFPEDWSHL